MHNIARDWGKIAIRGIIALIFGYLAALLFPSLTFGTLLLLFGAFAIVDCVFLLLRPVKFTTNTSGLWNMSFFTILKYD